MEIAEEHETCWMLCAECMDVIGVYEPLIHVGEDGTARRTSRAAEPAVKHALGSVYHAGCYPPLEWTP
jgi:hypothetical protein